MSNNGKAEVSEPELAALVGYLRAHGRYGFASAEKADMLWVLAVWTKHGVAGETWEMIPANLASVRAWLGY